MECKVAAGIDPADCDSRLSSPGINQDDIYIFNHSEIASYTSSVNGEVSGLTFTPSYETGFKIAIHKNSGQFTETLQTNAEAAAYYDQRFECRVVASDTATRNAIKGFIGVDSVIVFRQKNGKFRIIGESEGVRLTENEYDTGKLPGDPTGDMLVWSGVENDKARFFFNTSEATTRSTLEGYI